MNIEFADAGFELCIAHLARRLHGNLVGQGRFAPAAAGLHPEDRGGDALRAFGPGLAEQELGDLGHCRGCTEINLVALVLLQGLAVDADAAGYVRRGTPERIGLLILPSQGIRGSIWV